MKFLVLTSLLILLASCGDFRTKSRSTFIAPVDSISVVLEGRANNQGNYVTSALSVLIPQRVQLRWTVTGAPDECHIGTLVQNAISVTSHLTAPLSVSESYEIVCTKRIRNRTETVKSVLSVSASAAPALTVSLEGRLDGQGEYSINPIDLYFQQRVELRWSFTGAPDSCHLGTLVSDAKTVASYRSDPLTDSILYQLVCTRQIEDNTDSVTAYLSVSATAAPFASMQVEGGLSYDFGSVNLQNVRKKNFKVTNTGTLPISQFRLVGLSAPYSQSQTNCNVSIAPGNFCNFEITFAPSSAGLYPKELLLTFSDATGSQSPTLNLQGQGIGVVVSPGLDTAYGSSGCISSDRLTTLYDIALQSDGKFVFSGTRSSINAQFALTRLLPNGVRDDSFGLQGLVTDTTVSVNDAKIRIQPDGGIIVGLDRYGTLSLRRYLHNGSRDSTFGVSGSVEISAAFPPHLVSTSKWMLLPDGKILVLGNYASPEDKIILIRYYPNGQLDLSFGSNGRVLLGPATDIRANRMNNMPADLAVDRTGRILVTGLAYVPSVQHVVMRLSANGQLDSTFDNEGMKFIDASVELSARIAVSGSKAFVFMWGVHSGPIPRGWEILELLEGGQLVSLNFFQTVWGATYSGINTHSRADGKLLITTGFAYFPNPGSGPYETYGAYLLNSGGQIERAYGDAPSGTGATYSKFLTIDPSGDLWVGASGGNHGFGLCRFQE